MRAIADGFIYKTDSKIVINEVFEGNFIGLPNGVEVFYGTKEQAVNFGLVFVDETEQINDNEL